MARFAYFLEAFALVATFLADGSAARSSFSEKRRFQEQKRYQALAAGQVKGSPTLEERASGYHFLNNATQKYFVKSLPEVNLDIGELYSGLIPINASNPDRALFFAFQPKIGAAVDEVTIWLNGGPGCSSLDGFFQESGRFVWQSGTFQAVPNPYSWSNLTNMLYVEQPVGTGFSTGKVTATTEEEIAHEFVLWFKNFQKAFGIKNYKIFVTGESYAGRYVPYISAAMLDQKNTQYYNLKGAIAFDPCIGDFTFIQEEVPVVPFVQANNNLFNFNSTFLAELESLHQSCGYAAYLDKYLTFPPPGIQPPEHYEYAPKCDVFDMVNNAAFDPNPCFNIYEINQMCPLLWDVLAFPTELEYSPAGADIYFNRKDVKQAMHAPVDHEWNICQGPVFIGGKDGEGGPENEGDLSADPIQKVLPQVIEGTNRVLIGNGDYDMVILTNGTLLAIQNMTWNGHLGFQSRPATPINVQLPDLQYQEVFDENAFNGTDGPQGIMGIQHYERGLMWVQTYQSGHMQPEFQPRVAYRYLEWVLGRIDTI